METKKYKDDSIVIVAQGALRQTQKEILKQEAKGVEITTLNRFIQSLDKTNTIEWTLCYECYQRFKSIKDQLHYFKNTLLSSSFIDECLSFLDLLHFYEISLDELPCEKESDQELMIILKSIYDLKTRSICYKENLSSLGDLSNVYINIAHPTLIEEKYIQIFADHQAHVISKYQNKPAYEYYHANNPRCEIESIAQKIIYEEMDVNDVMIALCDPKGKTLLASVFDRYQIPYHLSLSKSSSYAFQAASLLEFALNPTPETFYECLTQSCFGDMSDLIKAQKIYPYAYDEAYPDLCKQRFHSDLFSEYEIKDLTRIIEKANLQKQQILPYCQRLLSDDIPGIMIAADEILRLFHASTLDFRNSLLKIQNLFKESLPYIKEKEDMRLLIDEIRKIRVNEADKRMNSVTVLPYSQINECLPITFICSATQNHFSSFTPMSGIFGENYVASIKKFPSLMTRYQRYHQSMLERILNGQRIIISYPLSDYVGKNFESSLDIEALLQKESIPYPLTQTSELKETILSLSENTAEQIYMKDHEIKGSVSSLEKYVGCPYAYFLRYGCHIKEPLEAGFNVQKIGTLNHAVLETLVGRYQKDYTKACVDEISEIIDLYMSDMKAVFPHIDFDLIRDRLIENMKMNLYILDEMEAHSSMTPKYCEYKWERIVPVNDTVNLHLVGYVDRIDTTSGTFRIMDYKSSSKRLQKDHVFSGQQLQLCTYLMQMKDGLKLRPLGGFYYSFQNGKLELPYQKLARRSKTIDTITQEAIQKEVVRANRLQGWIFDENVEIMDDDAAHVSGLKNTKSKGIYASSVFDIDEVSDCIQEMMKLIASQILSGDIRLEPNEAACLFCKYRPICRFNGSYTEKKQLVDLPPCMRKEEDHGQTME